MFKKDKDKDGRGGSSSAPMGRLTLKGGGLWMGIGGLGGRKDKDSYHVQEGQIQGQLPCSGRTGQQNPFKHNLHLNFYNLLMFPHLD